MATPKTTLAPHRFDIIIEHAPVAQMDRAFAFEAKGRGFESLRAHHISCHRPGYRLKSNAAKASKQALALYRFPTISSDLKPMKARPSTYRSVPSQSSSGIGTVSAPHLRRPSTERTTSSLSCLAAQVSRLGMKVSQPAESGAPRSKAGQAPQVPRYSQESSWQPSG